MNLRHAAALTLVGWYLMLPPAHPTDLYNPIDPASLKGWQVAKDFDSAIACHAAGEIVAKRAQERLDEDDAAPDHKLSDEQYDDLGRQLAPVCIATDDPRLKER
jgi:hypothetical protein